MEDKQKSEITSGMTDRQSPDIGDQTGTPDFTVASSSQAQSREKLTGFHLPGGLKLWGAIGIALLLVGLGIVTFFIAKRDAANSRNASLSAASERYESQKIDLSGVYPSDTINLSTSQSLSINGQLRTNNSLVLTPTDRPTRVSAGQIYYDKASNSPYIYNGQAFVAVSTGESVRSLGGAVGEIVLGTGLALQNGQLSLSQDVISAVNGASAVGVTSLQGQTGSVSLVAGSGIAINGTTITNTGVRSVQAASPQLTVTAAGNGVFSIGTVGDLLTGTGTAGQIAVFTGSGVMADSLISQSGGVIAVAGDFQATGQIQADAITRLTAGQDFTISAGSDQLVLVSEGRTFQLPSSGAVNQTICTVGMDCTTGGGATYVLLQPGTVQEDVGSGPSLFVNNSGGGDLLRLQGNGLNRLTVSNSGDSSFTGNMVVGGTINGATISGGNISGGTVNGAFISGGTLSGGTLTDTSVNGLNVSTSAISSTSSLNISAANNQNLNLNAFGSGVITIGSAELQGTGALLVTAGGIDQDLTLSGSGAGNVAIMVPRFIGQNGATYSFNASDLGTVNATICTSVGNCIGAGGGVGGGGTAGTIAVFNGTGFTIGDSLLSQSAGTVTVTGDLAATNLQGNGGAITDINAGNITVGVLSDGRLSNNVALYSAAVANFTGALQQGGSDVCTTAGNCVGSGAGGAIGGGGTAGTIAVFNGSGYTLTDSLLSQSATVVTVAGDLIASNLQGNGSAVTNVNAALLGGFASSYYLDASNISTGTLADGRLSVNVTMQGNTFNGANQLVQLNATGQLPALSGALLTNLNANSVTTGTLSDAHLSTNVALFNSATANFTGALQQGGNDVCTTAGNCVGSGGGAIGGGGTPGALAVFDGTGYTVADSILSQSLGVVTVAGDLVATNLQGNGSAVTNVNAVQLNGQAASYYLNADNLSTGTLADARLSTNVTLQGNTFNGASQLVQLNAVGQLPAISGALLTNLNAGSIDAGTLADARLSTNVTLQGNTFNGANQLVQLNASGQLPALSGALLTNLNASSIASGTLADGRLSANVALFNAPVANFTGTLQQGGNDVCTTAGNCVGSGGGGAVGGSGTVGTLAVFDGTGYTIADSLISQSGGVVNLAGSGTLSTSTLNQSLTLQGNGTGGVTIKNPSFNNANGATYTFNAADGVGVNATICTTAGNCVGSSGGAVGGGGTAGTLAVFDGAGFTISDSLLSQSGTVVTVAGDLVATNLQGNGSAITNVNAAQLNGQAASYYLNAGNINAGTLADARLSTNVTLQGNTFNGASQLVQLNVSGQLPAISGALLTNLDAGSIASGTLADGRLSTNVALYAAPTANFTGNLQEAGFDVCTTAGNCVGSGGGGAVGGSGTANTIAMFNGTGFTVGDSMLSQNASATILTVSGATLVTGTLGVVGDITGDGMIAGDGFNATSGGYQTGGTTRIGTAGDLQNITGFSQTSGNFSHSGTGNFSTGTGSIFLNGSTAINSTLNVSGATTFENYLTINGGQFTNNGSTLNTTVSLGDFAANGPIGTAATTVDRYTSIAIAQATAGITLTLPSPTTTTAGRVMYVMNTGSQGFVMHGATVAVGSGQIYMWNGIAWTLGASGGDGVGGNGTAGTIAVFDGTGYTIADSLLSQSGTTVTASGILQAATALQAPEINALTYGGNLNIGASGTAVVNIGEGQSAPTQVGIFAGNGISMYTDTNVAIRVGGTFTVATTGGGGMLVVDEDTRVISAPSWVSTALSGDFTAGGAITFSGLNSAGVVHTDALGQLSTSLVANVDLQGGTYSAITGTGALSAGSITTGFGAISTGNNITTTATLQGATINATSAIQTGGTTRLNSAGALSNISSYSQSSGAFAATGLSFAAITTSGGVLINANNTNIDAGTFNVTNGATSLQNTTINGTQFTNNGSTLNTALSLGNFVANGPIGTAAATVDRYTSIAIAQTSSGITLSLPNPTDTTAGRVIYVMNTATFGFGFTMHGVTVNPGYGQIYIWNGSAWVLSATGGGASISLQGAYDGGNTLNTTDARNIAFTLTNTTTDANFVTNIASGSTGQFKIQNNGTDILSIGAAGQLNLAVQGAGGGLSIGSDTTLYRSGANRAQMSNALTLRNTTDTSTAFQVQTAAGADVLSVDTASSKLIVGGGSGSAARLHVNGIMSPWTPRSAAQANLWQSVTYGNGLYVAVSTDGTTRVMTSPDGITWTARSAAQANSWESVTYADGLFVAVSSDGTNRVMTSPDGISWTAQTSQVGIWQSVTYGNGLFVAVSAGSTSHVMTSPDGITWTARTPAEPNAWRAVTYADGLFVAVSSDGTNRVMTSPDGITWTARNSGVNVSHSVIYAKGLFVAAGPGNLMTSPDGITWTARSIPATGSWRSVTYGNGLFVAVSDNSTLRVMTSPDGITWTAQTPPEANSWESITYANGLFVAVASDGTNRVMTGTGVLAVKTEGSVEITNGRFLTQVTGRDAAQVQDASGVNVLRVDTGNKGVVIGNYTGDAQAQLQISSQDSWVARTAAELNSWSSVTYGNGLFVAVANSGTNRVMTSPDGITWTARAASEANTWTSVTYGNGLFVAVANSGTNRVMTSPDGITWTARAASEANAWTSVTYGNGLFVAVAINGTNRVMTSPDGITWTARSVALSNWYGVTYGNGLFVAVTNGGGNRAMTSPDGITWTARATPAINMASVTYGNGLFVAVANSGTDRIATSADGITWTARTAPQANNWNSVTYGNGRFVAVASTGANRVMSSSNGITWVGSTASEANSWSGVTHANGTFVAVSNSGTNRVMTRKPSTTPAMLIQDAIGAEVLNVNTATRNVTVSNLTVAAYGALRVTGGDTSTRPTNPAEGTVYFDTTTKQLIYYANGQWKSASQVNSVVTVASQTSRGKDGADFVVSSAEETAGNADATIAAAVAALPAGGGTVYLMEGTYTLDTAIYIPSNTTFAGSGRNSTILKLKNGHNASINILNVDAGFTYHTNITIKDLAIDGNKANQTAGTQHGIHTYRTGNQTSSSVGITIDNVYVKDMRSNGTYIEQTANSKVTNSYFMTNGGVGLYANTATSRNSYINNTSRDNTGIGIDVEGDYDIISNNHVQGNGSHGIDANGVGAKVTDNTVTNNGGIGINSTDRDAVISGNLVGSNTSSGMTIDEKASVTSNQIESNGGNGIYSQYLDIAATISNNIIRANTGSGITFNRGGANSSITGNTIESNTVAGIEIYGYIYQIETGLAIGNNYIGSNATYGIYLSSVAHSSVTGNTVINNGGATTNNGIYIGNGYSGNVNITGNTITDTSCTTSCNAILIDGRDNVLSGNTIGDATLNDIGSNIYGQGEILDNGTNTNYVNQRDGNGNLINRSSGAFGVNTKTVTSSLTLQGGMTNSQLPTPGQPTVARVGTAGTTTYGYRVTALDGTGETLASTERTITNAFATLDGTNYNVITWAEVPGAVQYRVYRSTSAGTPATTGLIGTVTGGSAITFNDTGIAGTTAAPVANSTGGLQVASSIQGTTATLTGGVVTVGTAAVQGSLVVSDGSNNTATIQVGDLAGNYTYTIPVTTGNDTFCMLLAANCGGIGSLGALDGGTPSANGASIVGGILYLQSASSTNPGLVNTTTQTFAGNKTFVGSGLFKNTSDSVAAFQIQSATSSSIFNVDTTNMRISIGAVGGFSDTPTKLANPATLPAGTGYGTAFSPDGQYMSVAHVTSPFVTIYKRSGDTFTKLANPATLPAGAGTSTAFSPDGQYMSVAHQTSPFVTIYKRSGDTFTKLANPATLPAGLGLGTAFSPSGQYMSVAHQTSPFVTIYKRSGDTFTKLADPATLPTGSGQGTAFSLDGQYMSVAHQTSPFVTIYKRSGDIFTKLADPTTLPTGTGTGTAFSPDGQYMSVAHQTSPFVTIYKRSGDTFTKLANPATLPTGTASNGTAFSPDGQYLSVVDNSSPFVTIYKGTGGAAARMELASGTTTEEGLAFGKELKVYRSGPGTLSLATGGSLNIEGGNLSVQGGAYFAGNVGIGATSAGNLLSVGALTTTDTAGQLAVSTGAAGNKGLIIQGVVSQTGDLLQAQDSTGAVLAKIDASGNLTVKDAIFTGTLTVNGHIITGGSTPTIAAGAAACTTPTVTMAGTDTAGTITVTTGTGCAPTGKLATITFATTYGSAPRVALTPANSLTAGLNNYIDDSTISATAFDLGTNTAPADSTTYKWYYHVIQ